MHCTQAITQLIDLRTCTRNNRVHVDVQKMAQLDADMDEARERDQAMRQLEVWL